MDFKSWQAGRNDGLAVALKIVQEGGVELLEKEIKERGIRGLNTNMTMKELDDAGQTYRENCVDTVLAMMLETIHDEFGHGTVRLQRLVNRFRFKASCLGPYVKWRDIQEDIITRFKLENCNIRNLEQLDTIWKERDA